ncbi:MAG: sulfotransferase domain-containing protein [Desulfobacterales bacterium]|nr:sulfotransferase domain-containing protein [Desulfobacterales bacterium]
MYIVEYPKSGITWFSTILANIALLESRKKESAGFPSARMYIPDIHITRHIGPPLYSRPMNRLIKSHSAYNPNYYFTIYLTREPAAVMKSYYIYLLNHGEKLPSFSDFCFSDRRGIQGWRKHINSWLTGPVTGRILHIICYEDLIESPHEQLNRLSLNFGWNFSHSSIDTAVKRSEMETMRASENFYAKFNPRHTIEFVGAQKVIDDFEKVKNQINTACRDERERLGYE